jgi:hypothetical protein
VFADGVEAEILCLLDIELERGIRRSRVDTVRPVALVESGQKKGRRAIQGDALLSADARNSN